MTNNDILRRLRYALDINDSEMIGIFKLAGLEIDQSGLTALLKKEFDAGYVDCSDKVMENFLDGLIIHRRGRKETAPVQAKKPDSPLTNNAILKKLRIALELKEDDMIGILKLAGVNISGHELTALFRKQGHRNYKECGDQFLRNFLKGITVRYGN
ncbi:MAG: DUF1456 family protein [Nitrospirae bacterium]|nr:DUF1456 family protein [Nitrospirota bacterium]